MNESQKLYFSQYKLDDISRRFADDIKHNIDPAKKIEETVSYLYQHGTLGTEVAEPMALRCALVRQNLAISRGPFHYAHMFREALVKDIARQLLVNYQDYSLKGMVYSSSYVGSGEFMMKHWSQLGDPRGSSGCADLLRRGVAFAAELYRAKVILPTDENFRACLLPVILNPETIRAPGDLDISGFRVQGFQNDVLSTQGSLKLVESI
ncbi:hypothetical protein DFP72DRAFT_858498 [Ephemerocybe angulata]|uniref:Uncharacterized protein n=1 Tax=Ephemerocybe angulata TaxID=980116 RepID=A0A8H6HAW4_9AGAR|nr:hypothetical protein DFP72DRAFT_858498 [Tulosesus angulatus]